MAKLNEATTEVSETADGAQAAATNAQETAHEPDVVETVQAALTEDEASPTKKDSAEAAAKAAESPKGKETPADGQAGAAAQPAVAVVDDDKVPEGLSEDGAKRFKALVDRRKEAEGERDDWKGRAEQWQQVIESTHASPEQFGQMLEYTRAVNSGDPAQLRSALQMAKDAVRDLSVALGEDVQNIDAFSAHPDIAEKVGGGDLDRATAMELVRGREAARISADASARARATSDEEAQIQAAQGQLNQLGAQLRASDPDFERKLEYLKPVVNALAQHSPPQEWVARFMGAYRNVQLPAALPVQNTTRIAANSAQPLRNNGIGAPNMRGEPKTAEAAVMEALGMG